MALTGLGSVTGPARPATMTSHCIWYLRAGRERVEHPKITSDPAADPDKRAQESTQVAKEMQQGFLLPTGKQIFQIVMCLTLSKSSWEGDASRARPHVQPLVGAPGGVTADAVRQGNQAAES
ncbi:hypothetical protein DPEC_G00026430 [Dallia pectoralis]|uniref:Uncharacterized protein n=1 Tax=Dallia pectoralis TaxID=75939 RepID=A0ACC2HHX7_DALPE|nr:hypothetical protein DPEC_G00026430 [Dallia pectoralis]